MSQPTKTGKSPSCCFRQFSVYSAPLRFVQRFRGLRNFATLAWFWRRCPSGRVVTENQINTKDWLKIDPLVLRQGSLARSSGRNFSTTSRLSLMSSASWTTPMPQLRFCRKCGNGKRFPPPVETEYPLGDATGIQEQTAIGSMVRRFPNCGRQQLRVSRATLLLRMFSAKFQDCQRTFEPKRR